jgi:hypothetical protein
MKKVIVFTLLVMLCAGCKGQEKKTVESRHVKPDSTIVSADSLNPRSNIIVNRKLDDKGNLIEYDSTYSYSYTSPGFNRQQISSDSLFGSLKGPLQNDYERIFNKEMKSIFFNDSLFKYDFLNGDYFTRRFQLNMQRFEQMFQELDSLKTGRIEKNYPQGSIKKNE